MIFPHATREDAHIDPATLSNQPEMHLYSVAYMVFVSEDCDPNIAEPGWILGTDAIPDISPEKAKERYMDWLKGQYKECQGCFIRKVVVAPVGGWQLAKAGYSRK